MHFISILKANISLRIVDLQLFIVLYSYDGSIVI